MASDLKAGEILLVENESLPHLLKDDSFVKALSEQLKIFLPSKRWYGAKDDVIASILPEKTVPVGDVIITVVRVRLESGDEPLYAIPLRLIWGDDARALFATHPRAVVATVCFGQKLGVVYDAMGDASFSARVVSLMTGDAREPAGGDVLRASSTAKGKALGEDTKNAEHKLLGVEQSNSSIVVGHKMILKMYRRVAYGHHPEIATTCFLTEEAAFENTPAYLGAAELECSDGQTLALGILQEFVPNQGDGWNYTMNYLKKFFADALSKQISGDYHRGYLDMVRTLGVRTAEMHRAFAKGTDAVFSPEPVTAEDLNSWREQVRAQAAKTRDVIENGLENLSGDIRVKTGKLLKHWDDLAGRINALVPSEVDAAKTRFHGDYHLGQVVVAGNDFYILDFEGEPLRPLMERQIKHTVLKDVAGMVRSFDYAAFGALLMYVVPEHRAVLTPLVSDWQAQATAAFLAGYFDAMDGCRSLPADRRTAQDILDLFILEKALYEVVYEVSNRPDWVAIPVNGMARLVDLDGESK